MMTQSLRSLIDHWAEIAETHRQAERSSINFKLSEEDIKYHRDQAKRLDTCIAELLKALDER